jgi:hypothetical protein
MEGSQDSKDSNEEAKQGGGGESKNAQQYFWELPPSMQHRKD